MKAAGVDISGQRSRKFVRSDFNKFDRILVMDQSNLRDVLSLAKTEEHAAKVALFDATGVDVPDPYYGGEQGFSKVREQVRVAAQAHLKGLN